MSLAETCSEVKHQRLYFESECAHVKSAVLYLKEAYVRIKQSTMYCINPSFDTYINLSEMAEYLKTYKLSSDPLRVQWENMCEDDQKVLLRQAYACLNNLPLRGRPKFAGQESAFPRGENFTPNDLLKVKYAQAEQALAISDSIANSEIEERMRLRRAGVVQYKIGDLSEKFQEGTAAICCNNLYGLSEGAFKYLSKWLQGGFNICISIKGPCGSP